MKHKITKFLVLILIINFIKINAFAQNNQFKPSYYENKAKATVHYFFSNFENNPRLSKGIISMLARDGFELIYPWGEYRNKVEVEQWIAEIPNEIIDAHHIKKINVNFIDQNTIKAKAYVSWQNLGPGEKTDSASYIYEFEMFEQGIGLLKIRGLKCSYDDKT